ncbi:hypothetical protein BTN49_2804 [Candidatus Enterovibrio escicola]|uniref:Uncharacterized protein n=1 Tax=Candidatus Enterovibrio escicola TaxID=1927127 RepID=A0A2A5T0F4_9GAMM|nr:hypothetical protein BTN49_2804 [Candidatus Enterovibrio escacola]
MYIGKYRAKFLSHLMPRHTEMKSDLFPKGSHQISKEMEV